MAEEVETPRVRLVVAGASGVGGAQAEGDAAFDPYCQAQCGDVVLRTAAQAKTTAPQWAQNFTFGVKKPLGDAVNFKVFGLNARGRDVLLGSAALQIEALTPDTPTTHKLPLCGELTVEATYEPNFMAPPRKEGAVTPKKKPTSPKKLAAPKSPKRSGGEPAVSEEKAVVSEEKAVVEGFGTDSSSTEPLVSAKEEGAEQQLAKPPNFYVVTILEATGLLACDGTGIEATSDPYVRISCTKNQSQRTKTQQQTLHPSWRQRFYFTIVPGEKQLLELTVEDSDLLTSDFMGRCVIDLDEFTKRFQGEKQAFWLALEQQAESKENDVPSDLSPQRKMNYGSGKICLAVETQYLDRDIGSLEQGEIDNVTEVPRGRGLRHQGSSDAAEDEGGNDGNRGEDTNEEANEGGDDDDVDARREEAEAQRKQREEERQKMLAELSNVQFLSGDYQIRVRIIEVRDLQPMDANGLCDPVVSVECLGQRQHTVVKQKQLSCVFDEYLYFNFRKLDKDTVQQGSIKISVFDADGPDHELKRKWVALVGSGTTNSDSIQGYVLLSLVVLGPNDKMKLYDPAEDRDPDEHSVKSKADINSMVLVPPRVTQKLSFLVITIYRAEELPDMDYSMMMHGGIDGYVRAYFAGQDVLETKKVTVKGSENLTVAFNQEMWFPVLLPTMSDNIFLSVWDWDMTADQLVANVLTPFSFKQNEQFLPKVSLQVYDWDRYDADDYVGGLKFSLGDFPQMSSAEYSKIRASGEYSAPRPKWYPICYEKPGDTQGELLLSFDLIKKDTPGVIVEPPETIRPPAEEAFVEIMCLGCRGLQPTGFMPINTPFAKFEIGEITKTNQPKFTNPSSKPSSRNPNFLQRIVVPVKMPLDSLFAPRLNITVYDQLLGGFYKPVIGVCAVDLSRKLPLSNGEPNPLYIEECSKPITRGSNPYVDYGDDLSTFPGTVPSEILAARSPSAATEKTQKMPNTIRIGGICSSGSFGMYDDDEDELPHYMHQREIVDGELEDTLKSPFETYTLFRGSMVSNDGCESSEHSSDTYRPVGKFKGIVRVLKSPDDPPLFDLDQFLNPQPYLVRVYVLDALNLHPKDANNRCDPYLRMSLGDGRRREQMFNDRDNYQSETLTPNFHKMYEFKADLPGASELKLEVLDYDFFAIPTLPTGLSKALSTAVGTTVDGDDFVGATLIDLEDRWFDAKWQELGLSPERIERRKPLEVRPLFAPSSTLPQGSLRLWVDILTGAEMNVVRPLDISLPPPQMFEVRVIIYKAKNVTPGDFTDLSDLFVKCWLQNRDDKSQSTDTHWRARHGRASFNWRMKFDVELPLDPEKESDRGCLHFQMWDRDVVYDDCLADAVVDLTPFLKTAFKTKQAVNVFAKPKPIRIRGTESMPYEGASRRSGYSATEDATSAARQRPPHSDEVVISIKEEEEGDRKPLLSGAVADIGDDDYDETEPEDVDADMENAESLVKSFMHRLGMGDDPEDASWLTMTTRDSHTRDRVRAGELLVSVEILPKHLAEVRSAGLGRGEPNNFPFLPEPADRLHLSAMWNPCYVLEALMGPKYYRAFASFFLCTVFVLFVLFAGPLINVLLTLFELVPQPFGLIFFFLLLALLMGTLVYLLYRCRRAIIRVSGGDDFNSSVRTKNKRKARRALR
ncbi:hypothetical protein PF011_g10847 [Phytophthora fragariae]|uniref:C2 domain-containing protein n=1 Tax=Phytophthora fragariae TaxID=53985 RepID=A0A6A3KWI0_9STRA|nr:hypothetical protein PF011_g10847 [Phytophthora fragariae]